MPNRFRPGVLPDYQPRVDQGERIARGIEAFEAGRDRARAREVQEEELQFRREDREWQREDRDHVRAARAQERVVGDMAFQEELQRRGLEPVMPRQMQEDQRRRMERAPDFGPSNVFEERQEFDPRSLFSQEAELGLQEEAETLLLPGQFRPGHGFSNRHVTTRDVQGPRRFTPPDPRVSERLAEPPRVQFGGREFAQTGPTLEDRQRQAFEEELRGLIDAGVPPEVARFAQDDPVLRRQFLSPPSEAADDSFTREELEALGLNPAQAAAGARDGALARRFLQDRLQDRVESGSGTGRVSSQELMALGYDETTARAGERDPTLGRQLVRDAIRTDQSPQISEATVQRRRNIEQEFNRGNSPLLQPWQQQIADRMAGIGPDGREIRPMTAQEIIDGFASAGTPEEQLEQIRRFIPRSLTR